MTWRFTLMIDPLSADDSVTPIESTVHRVDAEAAMLSVGEWSTQRGDGVFETMSVVDGHAQEVEAHLARLAQSARICDLPEPHRAQFSHAVQVAAQQCPEGEYFVKVVLSRGVSAGPAPTAWVMAEKAADFARVREQGVRVVTLERGYDLNAGDRAPWLLLGAKTLSYAVNMAALREARRRGADDAIFISTDGFVFEAPTASLIVRVGGRYITPAPHSGILHGTTQQSLFSYLQSQGAQAEYATIGAHDLATVDAAWLVSSVRLAVAITAIDGVEIPHDAATTAAWNSYLLSPRT
ncbi:aminodeoxychorismate lyase [Microbacterium sp. YY-01]|uniref:aminodeoxychorismate lyase n=1 Tax=Microbacterium sp. YY-01 TaxID=3421634 RepID=UPI003D16B453